MFSPLGKKKYLVQIKRAKDSGREIDPVELISTAYKELRGITSTKRPSRYPYIYLLILTSNINFFIFYSVKNKHPGINAASTTFLLNTLHDSDTHPFEAEVSFIYYL
jgi:hypothetical protein